MKQVAIIGGGPAGLMAAEMLSAAGCAVTVYESMPTVARKLLMAGKSGLNLTHSEDEALFVSRFGTATQRLSPCLDAFTPAMLRAWAKDLGQDTFIGTSGRVFPIAMKGSPLLRAWLKRLEEQGVTIRVRHRWCGMSGGRLIFETPDGETAVAPDATLLALGGASWPRLGSTGAWLPMLANQGVPVAPFRAANCGFDVGWSDQFRERFAGEPVKSVSVTSSAGQSEGEFVITKWGVEGSLVYAHAATLRDELADGKPASLDVDLAPGRSHDRLARDLAQSKRKDSLSNRLRKQGGLSKVKVALLRECCPNLGDLSAGELAARIKSLSIPLIAPRPLAEAISSAGGIKWEGVDDTMMLKALPGVFVAGEMLDWEAPTGGYLLTACFASGKAAARGALSWLGLTAQ